MIVKEIKPINFLYYRVRTTVGDLAAFIPEGQAIIREAVANNLVIAGPVHWHYYGFSPTSPFDLEIALPVATFPSDYDGKYHVKRSGPFRCVSGIHEGPWSAIPDTYQQLAQFVQEHRLSPTGTNREVYINVDLLDGEANTTEIQVGVE